jgi:CHRD domain
MRTALIAIGVAAASLAAGLAAAAATGAATTTLTVQLRGRNEVPAAPATNRGSVTLRLTPASGRVCWTFRLTKIDGKPNQAHIHKGGKGVSGPVVVPLYAAGKTYVAHACTKAKKSLVAAIVRRPTGYYVNVHNAKHPAGAMRGQL